LRCLGGQSQGFRGSNERSGWCSIRFLIHPGNLPLERRRGYLHAEAVKGGQEYPGLVRVICNLAVPRSCLQIHQLPEYIDCL